MWIRLGGLALIAAGVAIGWLAIWQPYQAALAGADEVSLHFMGFVGVPLCIMTGLLAAIGGPDMAADIMGPPETPRQRIIAIIVAVVSLAIGGAAYWWMDSQLSALGFS